MSVSHGRSRPIDFDGVSFAYAFAMLMVLNVKESVNVWLLEIGSFELPLASLKPISSSADGFTRKPKRSRKRWRMRSSSPLRKNDSLRTRTSPNGVIQPTHAGSDGAAPCFGAGAVSLS